MKNIKGLIIFIVISLYSITLFGGNYNTFIDSIYHLENKDSALSLLKNIEEEKHPLLLSNSAPFFYYRWADLYYYTGNYDSALTIYNQIINTKGVEDTILVYTNFAIASVYNIYGYHNLSNRYCENCIHIINTKNVCSYYINSVYNLNAINYSGLGEKELAIVYHRKSLQEAFKKNDSAFSAIVYNNLANLYIELEQQDSALYYLDKAEPNIQLKYRYFIYINRAQVFSILHKFDEAFEEINKIDKELIENEPWLRCKINLIFAQFDIENSNKGKAIVALEKASYLLNKIKSIDSKSIYAMEIAEAYHQIGLSEEALIFYKLSYKYQDTVLNQKNIKKINELKLELEFDKQEAELVLLKRENSINKRQKNTFLIIIIAFIIATAIAVYTRVRIYRFNKKKREDFKKEAEEQNRRLTSLAGLLIVKNENLIRIKEYLKENEEKLESQEYKKLLYEITKNINLDRDWNNFAKYFEDIHPDFFKKLKDRYPEVTTRDLKHCAFIKMNLSLKEVAILMNITARGVEKARSRLRAKISIDSNQDIYEYFLLFE